MPSIRATFIRQALVSHCFGTTNPKCRHCVSVSQLHVIGLMLMWRLTDLNVVPGRMTHSPPFSTTLRLCSVFSCDQAALQMVFSVCPSVCLSVCPSVRPSVTPFWLCSHHRIIMKFSGVITSDRSDVHAKGQGQRSKVKVTEVTTQLYRFRTVTPVWIHLWWWNDAYSLIMLRRGALLFFKVICQISRSHGSKNRRIWPRLGVSGLQLQFEFTNGYKMLRKAWSSIEEVPYCFSRSYVKFRGHMALKIVEFDPNWAFSDCNSSLKSPMATKWCTKLEVA